ncbi:unnamed protein product [Chrysoparadoxa australica]
MAGATSPSPQPSAGSAQSEDQAPDLAGGEGAAGMQTSAGGVASPLQSATPATGAMARSPLESAATTGATTTGADSSVNQANSSPKDTTRLAQVNAAPTAAAAPSPPAPVIPMPALKTGAASGAGAGVQYVPSPPALSYKPHTAQGTREDLMDVEGVQPVKLEATTLASESKQANGVGTAAANDGEEGREGASAEAKGEAASEDANESSASSEYMPMHRFNQNAYSFPPNLLACPWPCCSCNNYTPLCNCDYGLAAWMRLNPPSYDCTDLICEDDDCPVCNFGEGILIRIAEWGTGGFPGNSPIPGKKYPPTPNDLSGSRPGTDSTAAAAEKASLTRKKDQDIYGLSYRYRKKRRAPESDSSGVEEPRTTSTVNSRKRSSTRGRGLEGPGGPQVINMRMEMTGKRRLRLGDPTKMLDEAGNETCRVCPVPAPYLPGEGGLPGVRGFGSPSVSKEESLALLKRLLLGADSEEGEGQGQKPVKCVLVNYIIRDPKSQGPSQRWAPIDVSHLELQHSHLQDKLRLLLSSGPPVKDRTTFLALLMDATNDIEGMLKEDYARLLSTARDRLSQDTAALWRQISHLTSKLQGAQDQMELLRKSITAKEAHLAAVQGAVKTVTTAKRAGLSGATLQGIDSLLCKEKGSMARMCSKLRSLEERERTVSHDLKHCRGQWAEKFRGTQDIEGLEVEMSKRIHELEGVARGWAGVSGLLTQSCIIHEGKVALLRYPEAGAANSAKPPQASAPGKPAPLGVGQDGVAPAPAAGVQESVLAVGEVGLPEGTIEVVPVAADKARFRCIGGEVVSAADVVQHNQPPATLSKLWESDPEIPRTGLTGVAHALQAAEELTKGTFTQVLVPVMTMGNGWEGREKHRCLFNPAASAAVFCHDWLGMPRVAVLELHRERGWSTQELLCSTFNPSFFYASIHSVDQVGAAAEPHSHVMLRTVGNNPESWKHTMRDLIFQLERFRPSLIIVQSRCTGWLSPAVNHALMGQLRELASRLCSGWLINVMDVAPGSAAKGLSGAGPEDTGATATLSSAADLGGSLGALEGLGKGLEGLNNDLKEVDQVLEGVSRDLHERMLQAHLAAMLNLPLPEEARAGDSGEEHLSDSQSPTHESLPPQ